MGKTEWVVVLVASLVLALLIAMLCLAPGAGAGGPAPTSTYIQFPGGTPAPLYPELPTPVPFGDMPLLYYHDDAHKVGCWVTFNHAAVSCLADPAEPPPCAEKALNDY